MRTRSLTVTAVIALLLVVQASMPECAHAQYNYTLNYQTNTISVVSNWTGNGTYVIGSNTFLNSLNVNSGGKLFDGSGYLGYLAGSSNNAALVRGSGSIWSNSSSLFVGNSGIGNALTITNGGAVYNSASYIGHDAVSNNAVTVTSTGSVWTTSGGFNVGYFGSSNTLTIANGGVVSNQNGFNDYIGYTNSANNNAVTVTGAGSVWTTSGNLTVGNSGSSNALSIANGAAVYNSASYIGHDAVANNAVTVTGTGSVWNTSGGFNVGYFGSSNTLTIANGGIVSNQGGFNDYIGYTNSANNNAVAVTGAGSVWSTSGNLTVGNVGTGNTLTITNGGAVYNYSGYIGDNPGANGNSAQVSGTGSVWNNMSGYVIIGLDGTSNTLSIANGGAVSSYSGYIGFSPGANGNSVLVSGTGSVWSNTSSLYVSDDANSGNSLTITNGGSVISDGGLIATFSPSSSNNSVLVTGAGSVWNNTGTLSVGDAGTGNRLTIANGGVVSNQGGYYEYIGNSAGANNNAVLVTGTGSVWNISGGGAVLYVGYSGVSNTLTIANDGAVNNGYGYIGYNTGSSNNSVTVTAGSVWNNAGFLYVGYFDNNNALTVTGTGSVLNVGNPVYVGVYSSGNTLTIANGAYVSSYGARIGWDGANNNAVTVTGTGSVWNTSGGFNVGYSGSSNTLTITNGGSLFVVPNVFNLDNGVLVVSSSGGANSLIINGGSVTVDALIATNGLNSVVTFSAGLLASSGTSVTNNQLFVVGDGTDAATFQLNGGIHSFANNLKIRNNATLTGCGTIEGNVSVDPGGTVVATCGGTLTFSGIVTNTGSIIATNGTTIDFFGPLVGDGTVVHTDGNIQFLAAINTSSLPPSGGSASGAGAYLVGSNVMVCATANPSYIFANWTVNGTVVSASECYTFTAVSGETLVANFVLFEITSIVRTNANDLLITWNTSGASNIVQAAAGTGASGSFLTNSFTDLTNIVVTTVTTNFWDVGAATNRPARYYRIRSPQ